MCQLCTGSQNCTKLHRCCIFLPPGLNLQQQEVGKRVFEGETLRAYPAAAALLCCCCAYPAAQQCCCLTALTPPAEAAARSVTRSGRRRRAAVQRRHSCEQPAPGPGWQGGGLQLCPALSSRQRKTQLQTEKYSTPNDGLKDLRNVYFNIWQRPVKSLDKRRASAQFLCSASIMHFLTFILSQHSVFIRAYQSMETCRPSTWPSVCQTWHRSLQRNHSYTGGLCLIRLQSLGKNANDPVRPRNLDFSLSS